MIKLNLVYSDHSGNNELIHENEYGKVWLTANPSNEIANVAMNYYSANNIKSNDSIFLAEPICVLERNYDINFLKQFKYVFTWGPKIFQGTPIEKRAIYVNFPSYRHNPQIDSTTWIPWEKRANEIVFIANNKTSRHPSELYSLRLKLADWLHANSSFNVSWYGNMPVPRAYYRGKIQNKNEVLSKVKFSVCIENSYDLKYTAGFLTEKLPDVWLAGAIPIYMGCSNLHALGIPENSYINLLPFKNNFTALNQLITNFSENQYYDILNNYKYISMYEISSYQNMCDIMIKTYYTSTE